MRVSKPSGLLPKFLSSYNFFLGGRKMISRKLKFCAWNIHGFKSREIGIKLHCEDFIKGLQDADVIGLTETHMHDETLQHLNIPGFHRLSYRNRDKNTRSNTAPSGIAVFVKKDLANLFSVVNIENEDIIWVKIRKELSGEETDIFWGTCYFSPSTEN